MRAVLVMAATALVGCGPSASQSARAQVKADGTGPDIVKGITHGAGTRLTYEVLGQPGQPPAPLDAVWTGQARLGSGVTVDVNVTGGDVAYFEFDSGGQYLWGTDTDGVYATPFLSVHFPLREGTWWQTGDEKTPGWYQYQVEAIEPLDTPAGTFTAARVLMMNTKTGEQVTRWYADRVGLVRRHGNGLDTHLLRFTLTEGTP